MAGISDPGYNSGNRHHLRFRTSDMHSLEQMIADPQRVRDDGQSWVDRAAGTKEACIDNVEII